MTVAGESAQAVPFSTEAELLLCCARTRMEAATEARLTSLLQAETDWDNLLPLAQRHKVVPLLYRQLNALCPEAVPADVLDRLQNSFYLNTARNHLLTAELCRILKLFAEHSIPLIPYKGPALALKLYGDISLRQFSDLDVLIHRRDVSRAAALLEAINYRKQHQLTRAQETAFQRSECEHLFSRSEDRLYLDLHWQFVPRYFSIKFDAESFWQRLEESDFEGQRILSFRPEDLLLILCVHAAKEFWERLVWLCDLNELIISYPHLDWQQVMERAHLSGTRRMLLTSLALTHNLLGTTLPAEIARAISEDRVAQALVEQIKQHLFQKTVETAGVSRFVLPSRALERLRDRISFHLRLALTPSPEDWTFARVPDQLLFLYFFIRPVRLARKYLPGR